MPCLPQKVPVITSLKNSYPGYFYCLEEDNEGNIWAGSGSYGLLRITPSDRDPGKPSIKNYSTGNNLSNKTGVQTIFKDSKNRIWAGTDGNGLHLYDVGKDTFICLNEWLNLPGDGVFSIEEDGRNDLWLGTNAGLVRLTVPQEPEESTFQVYTMRHGLQDNTFLRGVSAYAENME
ncbi:MAG: hypothetical protein LUE93_14115 [Bacteroides sp.]|nr:hypothetical protein [Bacteroides sp.]